MTLNVSTADQVLENIKRYIETEGLKRNRLAKRLGMSDSNFSEYLNGKRSNIMDFSTKLSHVLGLESTFFINKNFSSNLQPQDERVMAYSIGEDISLKGKEGITQLLRLCDLIDLYNMEG